MGMIANYQSTTDIELEKFTCLDDVEEAQEDVNVEICDIDKIWDALHFLLTGKSASEPIEDDVISEAIVGHFNIYEEDYIVGTKSDRVKEIAKALQEIDFEAYLNEFEMSAFRQKEIYPNIWEYEEEADKIKDELRDSFESLKKFYEKIAEQEKAEEWRKAWADITNKYLEENNIQEKVDHRSFQRQGIKQIPTIHLGVSASQMEKKGITTDRGNINREIKHQNAILREIKRRIKALLNWIRGIGKEEKSENENTKPLSHPKKICCPFLKILSVKMHITIIQI